jgi:molybdopterin/thiamine biosynthesis adenylyltransferase
MANRYARIEQAEMIGSAGLETLHRSTAAVLGVGNLGGEVARHLAMLGVGMVLVDRDSVTEENLGNQGFAQADMGSPKVKARAAALSRLNPNVSIHPLHADLERLGLGALHRMNIIFCCLDSARARVVVNEIASRLGIPWVDAALDGSGKSFFGRVAAYDPRAHASPCYLCAHDRDSLRIIVHEGRRERCPTWEWGQNSLLTPPTLAISALGSAVAAVQVIWGLQILLDKGGEKLGKELYLDLESNLLTTHRLKRNPSCLFDHKIFELTTMNGSLGDNTVADTFAAAETRLGQAVILQLHRFSIAIEIRCPQCAATRRPYRLLEFMAPEEALCDCGASMQPLALGLADRFGKEEAKEFAHKTWRDIGLPIHDVVTATNGSEAIHFVVAEANER